MSAELDKKIRKKQASIFDPKESIPNRVKACIFLSENLHPNDLKNFLDSNKESTTGLLTEVSQYILTHTKKGKIVVPAKDATLHINLLRIATKIYYYNEFIHFDLYVKFLHNYLKIESNSEIREKAFDFLIEMILTYGEQTELTDLFIKSLNLGYYAEICFCSADSDIDQEMTLKFVTKFLTALKKPSDFDKLHHLLEAILSYIYPTFADEAQFPYKQNHPQIGLVDELPPSIIDKHVLDSFKGLLSSPVIEKVRNLPTFSLFIKHFYLYVLQLPPDDTTSSVILSTIEYFLQNFVIQTFTLSDPSEYDQLKHYLIETISVLHDKPFLQGNKTSCTTLASSIKKQIIRLTDNELPEELKNITIETVLNCIDLLVQADHTESLGSYIDLIFIIFIKWQRLEDVHILRDRLITFLKLPVVSSQFQSKFNHCTRLIISDFYSPSLLEDTDDVIVGSKKVAKSIRLEVPEPPFEAPEVDTSFSQHFKIENDAALTLWNFFYELHCKINEIDDIDCYEQGMHILYDVMSTLIKAETRAHQKNLELNPKRPNLIDVFGSIFFAAFNRKEHSSTSLEWSYRAICRMVNRSYVRYTNDLYSLFYATITTGLNVMPVAIMEEVFDIIPNQIPGWPVLIVPLLNNLQNLKIESMPITSNPNRDSQVVALLNSIVTAEENYPTILSDVHSIYDETLRGSFADSVSASFENLLHVFLTNKQQVSLLYGIASHIIFTRRRDAKAPIDHLLDTITKRISLPPEDIYRPASEIIGQLASFNELFTVEDVQHLLHSLLRIVVDPLTKTEAIACVFTALTDWTFSPSSIVPKSLTPELTSTDPNVKYRACAPECAEAFLQSLLTAYGFVPSEKGNDKFLSTHVEEGEVTWWAYGNNILSIEKGSNGEFCNLVIRNAVGKTVWGVKSVSVLEELGLQSTTKRTVLTVKDIVKDAPRQVVKDREVPETNNVLREMILKATNEESDLLDWGLPNGVNRSDYDNDLMFVKDAVDNVERQVRDLGKHIESSPKPTTESTNEIDNTKLLIHSLLCQTQFVDPMPKATIGLIFVKKDQYDQYDILKNEDGSSAFREFASGLGWMLDIKTHNGFLGGLDKNYMSTGKNIRYFADATKEVIFHDITLMPTQKDDSQQLTKKRHVGNDYVHIVWNESGEYSPTTITSQFNAAHIIVEPIGNGLHRIRIWRKQNVRQFGPLMDGMIVGKELLPTLVRETAVNANYCCSLNISPDDYLKPYLRRTTLIKEIVEKNDDFPVPTFFSTLSVVTNPQSVVDLAIKK
ncbi:Rap/Ran GTPase-activating protein [Entamoeba marina]